MILILIGFLFLFFAEEDTAKQFYNRMQALLGSNGNLHCVVANLEELAAVPREKHSLEKISQIYETSVESFGKNDIGTSS